MKAGSLEAEVGPQITIGVCTRDRPAGLRRLWASLVALRVPDACGGVEVVVADNAPDAGARELVEALTAEAPWPCRYVHVATPGIPAARNALLDEARGAALSMVDDDQTVDPGWLGALWAVRRETGAAVVTGPAPARFERPPARWMVDGGFFEPPRHETGAPRLTAYTHNVLIDLATVRDAGVRFDLSRGLGGGSDELFFRQLRQAGADIVWADEALAYEWIPPSRARLSWLVRRTFRTGLAHAQNATTLGTPAQASLREGAGHVWQALPRLPWWWLTRTPVDRVQLLRDLAWGAGLVAGSLGARLDEYRRVHGA